MKSVGGDLGILPYDLRHAFGTTIARQGINAQVLAKTMGHSVQMTERYIHLDEGFTRSTGREDARLRRCGRECEALSVSRSWQTRRYRSGDLRREASSTLPGITEEVYRTGRLGDSNRPKDHRRIQERSRFLKLEGSLQHSERRDA